jgi:hypothetical protein
MNGEHINGEGDRWMAVRIEDCMGWISVDGCLNRLLENYLD